MSEPFIGETILWPVQRGAPVGWAICDGSTRSINDYPVAFNLLGTTYGGDGQNTFGLPDLRGRVPVHQGSAPGMQNYQRGQQGGAEQVSLTAPQLPVHSHPLSIANSPGTSSTPTSGGAIASMGPSSPATGAAYVAPGGTQVALAGIGSMGGSQPHNNIQPSIGLSYIMCLEGVYPPLPN